jgi:hypothetical protein
MLRYRTIFQLTRRLNSNFVYQAGLFERTSSTEYAKRPFLIQDESNALNYSEFNNRVGQFASLLSSKYGLKVSELYGLTLYIIERRSLVIQNE